MPEPVSIRTRNPGAMWPGAIATQFGSTRHEDLSDGNKAAIFPTFEQGAAAQFALWAKSYSGMTLQDAIYKWSGHNSSDAYSTFLRQRTGVPLNTVITRAFLASPGGLNLLKAQALWETGRPYPMTDVQWRRGQALAFGEAQAPVPVPDVEPVPPPAPKSAPVTTTTKVGGSATAGAGAAVVAHQSGLGWPVIIGIAVVVAVVAFIIIHSQTRK